MKAMNLFTGEIEPPSMAAGVSGGSLFAPAGGNSLFGGLINNFRQTATIQQPAMMQTNIGELTFEQMESQRVVLNKPD